MTNTELLKRVINESGVTIVFLAKKLGCSRNRIYNILSGSECTASEIVKLGESLHMTQKQRDDIFLRKVVTDSNSEG